MKPVKTPCIGVCTIDARNMLCAGCYRTLDEVARWTGMSDADREKVMTGLPARREENLKIYGKPLV